MSSLNFPASPTTGQVYTTPNGVSYRYNGTFWNAINTSYAVGGFSKLDDISSHFNGSNTTFSLTSSGVAVSPQTQQNLNIVLGGIPQEPGTAYTISGSTITFSEAPTTGTSFYGVLLGDVMNIGVPSDQSVSFSKLDATLNNYITSTNTRTYNIPNSSLANSSIVINGTSISLGGSGSIEAAPTIYDDNSSNSFSYILVSSANSGSLTVANTSSSKLKFNPGTGVLSLSSNGAIGVPIGNTAQRPSNPTIGYVRFNTETGVLENYTPTGWLKVSLQQPTISGISGNIYNGNTSILTITGTNFLTSGAIVTFSGANTASVSGLNPTNSGSTITTSVPESIYTISEGSSVSVTVTNSDGATSAGYTMVVTGLPSGGSVSSIGNTRIHTFTASGTFTVPTGFTSTASYLVIAGGGGGGSHHGGGGGAGGYRTSVTGQTSGRGSSAEPKVPISSGSYTVIVGSGGGGIQGSPSGSPNSYATPGGSSSVLGISSVGGGGGGGYPASGGPGGSGGGGSNWTGTSGGSGTSGQGYDGTGGSGNDSGGGGGGAGSQGSNRDGGSGISSNITGTAITRAGGGGAAGYSSPVGIGGPGGGGPGGSGPHGSGTNGTNGTTNTGSGGGGTGDYNRNGGNGGSGLVIVSYTIP